jgi:hypothetical protein
MCVLVAVSHYWTHCNTIQEGGSSSNLEINWYCTATTSATLGLGGVPAGQPSFRDRLANDPEVTAKLSKEDLDHAFDIRHHTRFSGTIIDRALRDKDH